MGIAGSIRNIGAVDVDPQICEDYRSLTGSPITCMDLFSRDQYRDFHGCEPPDCWREATPADILQAAGGRFPHVVFTSPPCKGFSGLLPAKSAGSVKYQALNRLTVRGIRLILEAFAADLPAVILLENVPRIKTRGSHLLAEIKTILKQGGYLINEADHDCGEIGGLGQRRRRYLLIARNPQKCRPFIYQPPQRHLKTIGDVIGPLPFPDDPSMGPMHRLPRLKWLTWLRLALIPAGGDWRDLQKIAPEEYRLMHEPRGGGPWGVQKWEQPSGTVTGSASVKGSNSVSVADPRLKMQGDSFSGSPGLYGVNEWDETAPAVTASASVSSSNCPAAIADPRLPESRGIYPNRFRVIRWDSQSPVVTGDTDVQCGAPSISDPRLKTEPRSGYMHVIGMDEVSPAVVGAARTTASNGPSVVADHRLGCTPRGNTRGPLGVQKYDETASTVFGSLDLHAGPAAVADIRIPGNDERLDPPPVIIALDGTWHRPLTTLELLALQSFPVRFLDGSPVILSGKSDSAWRERIGNAVPPEASRRIHEQILLPLLQHAVGETFVLSSSETPLWVRREAILRTERTLP
jgi:site-specific DNA-cytosine methylase